MFPKRLLLTAEAGTEVAAGGGTAEIVPTVATTGVTPLWYAPAESLKTSDPEIWQSFEKGVQSGAHKDLASLIKERISFEKKLGSALTLPNKEKPEEVAIFNKRLEEAGLRTAPKAIPESPDKYDVKLDGIPEIMRSEPTVKALKEWAHKNGIPNDAVSELVALEAQRYAEVVEPALKYTAEQGMKAIAEFAESIGKEPKEVEAYTGAWLTKNFNEEEMQEMQRTGVANSPVHMKLIARAGLDTGEDISVIDGMGAVVDTEYDEFMKNMFDANHADHKLWMTGDPQDPKRKALQDKFDALNLKKIGTGEVK